MRLAGASSSCVTETQGIGSAIVRGAASAVVNRCWDPPQEIGAAKANDVPVAVLRVARNTISCNRRRRAARIERYRRPFWRRRPLSSLMSLFTQHFQFTRPLGLLLLLGLPYFYWLHRRTVTDMSTARKRVALALRLILITLLVLALAGLRYVQPGDALAVVFVVDGSKSVRDDQRAAIEKYMSDAARTRRQVDKVGVITFAQDPHTQSTPGQPFDASRLRDPGIVTATDIEKALRFAKIELDSTAKDAGKRVVLISDGNQTAGNALKSVRELAAAHIVLDTVTVNSDVTRE